MKKITERVIQEIKEKIVSHFQVEKIILFGSYIDGSFEKGSDLDILIIKESDVPKHKRSIPIRSLFRGYRIPMDIIVYTKEELETYKEIKGSFVQKVLSKGRIIYG